MFVTALSSNEDNTCWHKAHWPVALCVRDGEGEMQKYTSRGMNMES